MEAVFTEDSFWYKLSRKVVKTCGIAAEKAIAMFFCMKDGETPAWAKAKIAAALTYFVCPVDLVPDAIPVVGYSDDAGVLALAFVTVVLHIKKEHREKAAQIMAMIIGRFEERFSRQRDRE